MSEAVFEAIAAGDEDRLKELIDLRPDLAAARNEDGLSAVLSASYRGADTLVSALLNANPALDVFDAAAVGRSRGLAELLDGESELVRRWSADGFTPLHLAAYFGREDAAKLLLERGADVDAVARHATLQVAPLHSAAAGGHPALVRVLLEGGADPNPRQGGGFTPLHSSAQNGDDKSVELLVEGGADATALTDDGSTPAALAAAAGHAELAARLAAGSSET